jgi:DNA-binding LacI/PurR family transcriptional regulator
VIGSGEQLGHLYPDLTLVDVPGGAMLDTATQMLRDLMIGDSAHETVLLPARLVERGSTSAPAPGQLLRLR